MLSVAGLPTHKGQIVIISRIDPDEFQGESPDQFWVKFFFGSPIFIHFERRFIFNENVVYEADHYNIERPEDDLVTLAMLTDD